MQNENVKQAVQYLRQGKIIAYPTEAVYGLGCDPYNETALKNLLKLKQRSWKKGLILIASDYKQLEPFLQPLTSELETKLFASWPGPITWLLPAKTGVSHYLRGKSDKLAVRVTAHPQVIALCKQWGKALVSTSANTSDIPPCITASEVECGFEDKIDYLLPGQVGDRQRPSEIRDALTDEVLRN
ncbi:L-threonylcarbamoyladenylate synthase [Candidatus Halobeggiatoa sp. HSG11]|nr:L-threonylcarbamoyladenylate synthase [Candidatus Halobeggiatoa sp. HSG11]